MWSPSTGTLCSCYSVLLMLGGGASMAAEGLCWFLKLFPWGQYSCSTSLCYKMAFWLPWNQPLPRRQCRSSQVNRILHNQGSEVKNKMRHVVLYSWLKSVIRMQICKTRQSCYNPISSTYFAKALGWFTLQNFACWFHLVILTSKALNAYLCFKQTLRAWFRLSLNFPFFLLSGSLGDCNFALDFVHCKVNYKL